MILLEFPVSKEVNERSWQNPNNIVRIYHQPVRRAHADGISLFSKSKLGLFFFVFNANLVVSVSPMMSQNETCVSRTPAPITMNKETSLETSWSVCQQGAMQKEMKYHWNILNFLTNLPQIQSVVLWSLQVFAHSWHECWFILRLVDDDFGFPSQLPLPFFFWRNYITQIIL